MGVEGGVEVDVVEEVNGDVVIRMIGKNVDEWGCGRGWFEGWIDGVVWDRGVDMRV